MADTGTFRCELLTAQAAVLQTDATSAVFPAKDGMIGILPGRAPLVAAIGKGRVTIQAGGKEHRYQIAGGIAYLKNNVLSIMADTCEAETGTGEQATGNR